MLSDFADQVNATIRILDLEGAEYLRQRVRWKAAVNYRTQDLNDFANTGHVCGTSSAIEISKDEALARVRIIPAVYVQGGREGKISQYLLREILLSRLYVFAGSFPLRAIEPVCIESPLNRALLREGLSLLASEGIFKKGKGPGGTRCHLWIEDLDRWRSEALARPQLHASRDRHLAFFARHAEKLGAMMRSDRTEEAFELVQTDLDNFRGALEWSLRTGGDPAAGEPILTGLFRFWHVRTHQEEGLEWATLALQRGEDGSDHVAISALGVAGGLLNSLGRVHEAVEVFTRMLRLVKSSGEQTRLAAAHTGRGLAYLHLSKLPQARSDIVKAIELSRSTGDLKVLAEALGIYAELLTFLGEHSAADRALDEASLLSLQAGDIWAVGMLEFSRGRNLVAQGKLQEGETLYREAVQNSLALGDVRAVALILVSFAHLAVRKEQHRRAAVLVGVSAFAAEVAGIEMPQAELGKLLEAVHASREALGEEAFEGLRGRGYDMPIESASRFAADPDAEV